MRSCLEERKATDVHLEDQPEGELVFAQTPKGDGIFIVNLTDPDLSEPAIEELRKAKKRSGLGGIMITATFNEGYTLVGVIGREGIGGGVPSLGSEALAKACATQPRASIGSP
jgi:hypothetical protein